MEANAQKWANFLTERDSCKFYHQKPLPEIASAENLAITMKSVMTGEKAVIMWWNSTGHRDNMMSESYSRIGVGFTDGCRRAGHLSWIAVALYA